MITIIKSTTEPVKRIGVMTELTDSILELNSKGFTNLQIAEKLNINVKKVVSDLNRYGFSSNRYENIEITDEFEQFIIGTILGDGSFTKEGQFSVAHCLEQKEYCIWKHTFLSNYNLANKISENKIYSDRYTKGYIEEIRFKSKTHPIFKEVRERIYVDGKKTIDEDYINKIDAFALAIWYMDDGYVTKNSMQISSMRFSMDTLNKIQSHLKNKFDINTNLVKSNEIYIVAESKSKFINVIKPYILPCFEYKLISYADR